VADVITLPRPTRTDGDSDLDLPPCGNAWQPLCPHGGPHACWTWRGWPHICRCLRCDTRPVTA
jgi:hypothetical protein